MAESARRARLEQLLGAARRLADPAHEVGRALRQQLLSSSGLSAAGIELGLTRSLEVHASEPALAELVRTTPVSARAHVLLSANVFVGALRAIAIALVASERVYVRASRRDPALAQALQRLLPELFELVLELAPGPGDHFWGYGSDATLRQVRAALPAGVWFHPHGHGIGVVVVEADGLEVAQAARAIALDTVTFDQRGCLSPRAVLVVGTASQTRTLAADLAAALTALENEVPAGPLGPAEQAEARQKRDAARYAFELFDAATGWVSVAAEGPLTFPASPRCLQVLSAPEPVAALLPYAAQLTCVGAHVNPELAAQLRAALPGARHAALGEMQRPPLDGPVDRRHDPRGELIA